MISDRMITIVMGVAASVIMLLGAGAVAMLQGVSTTQGAHSEKLDSHAGLLSEAVAERKAIIEEIGAVRTDILEKLESLELQIAYSNLDMVAMLKSMGTIPVDAFGYDAVLVSGQVVLLPSTVEQRVDLEQRGFTAIRVNEAVTGFPVGPVVRMIAPSRASGAPVPRNDDNWTDRMRDQLQEGRQQP